MSAVSYPYTNFKASDVAPYISAAAVTPSDSTDLTWITRGLYIGGAGNVAVNMADGTTVTFYGCLAGTVLNFCVSRVLATGTTATHIAALN
jgi:hypothetical protein